MSLLGAKLDYATSRFGLALLGGAFSLVGLGFLTSAGWHLMADAYGPEAASVATGLLFIGVGLILIARRPPPPQVTVPTSQALIAAFLTGLESGRDARK